MSPEPADPNDAATADGPGFDDALAELEGIVAELESDRLEVDQLAARVERAAELVRTCRARIDGTRLQVEEVLERLADEPDDGSGDTTSRSGDDAGDDDPAAG